MCANTIPSTKGLYTSLPPAIKVSLTPESAPQRLQCLSIRAGDLLSVLVLAAVVHVLVESDALRRVRKLFSILEDVRQDFGLLLATGLRPEGGRPGRSVASASLRTDRTCFATSSRNSSPTRSETKLADPPRHTAFEPVAQDPCSLAAARLRS